MVTRGGLVPLTGQVRGFIDNHLYYLRDDETTTEFIMRMSYLIRPLSDFWANPLTNEEAVYIVLANIPYEEPWLYIHENSFGEF